MTLCPKCGELAFAGAGKHTINKRQIAPGVTFSTQVYDEKPRGPKLIDPGRISDYWVCQSCGHDWEILR
jgi:hypothetical protein